MPLQPRSVPDYRQAAQLSLQTRPLRELPAGAALGLLCLSAAMAESSLAGITPNLRREQLLALLLGLPAVHCAALALWQLAVRPVLQRHFAKLMESSHLLLWVVSGELPPELSGLSVQLGISVADKQGFAARLGRSLRHWRALCLAAGSPPLPSLAWLNWGPVAGALAWTLGLWLAREYFGFSALLYPLLFVTLAFHLHGQLLGIARDEFTLALLGDLADPEPA